MRKLLSALLALLVAAPAAHAGLPGAGVELSAADSSAEETQLFSGGGTQLSNGIFFPGTAFANEDGSVSGEPLVVPKGNNIRLTNLDHFVVSGGAHGIRSFKRVKRGKRKIPLFSSKMIDGPGDALVVTSHVKPGTYSYYCPIHSGMLGIIKVE
jgi:hypothetical protein